MHGDPRSSLARPANGCRPLARASRQQRALDRHGHPGACTSPAEGRQGLQSMSVDSSPPALAGWSGIRTVMAAGATRSAAAATSARRRSSGRRSRRCPASAGAAVPCEKAASWLRSVAGDVTPEAIRAAILRRYGKDQTFSVPILTVLALTGSSVRTRPSAWRSVPQLPFELAALPHGWFQHLRLPVVSYALPALIAIGQVRHRCAPSRNPVTRSLRNRVRRRTHDVLREMQPESGGYLEATPLTSFVVMSLAGAGQSDSPVVDAGVRFLRTRCGRMEAGRSTPTLRRGSRRCPSERLRATAALPSSDQVAMRRWLLAPTEHTAAPVHACRTRGVGMDSPERRRA